MYFDIKVIKKEIVNYIKNFFKFKAFPINIYNNSFQIENAHIFFQFSKSRKQKKSYCNSIFSRCHNISYDAVNNRRFSSMQNKKNFRFNFNGSDSIYEEIAKGYAFVKLLPPWSYHALYHKRFLRYLEFEIDLNVRAFKLFLFFWHLQLYCYMVAPNLDILFHGFHHLVTGYFFFLLIMLEVYCWLYTLYGFYDYYFDDEPNIYIRYLYIRAKIFLWIYDYILIYIYIIIRVIIEMTLLIILQLIILLLNAFIYYGVKICQEIYSSYKSKKIWRFYDPNNLYYPYPIYITFAFSGNTEMLDAYIQYHEFLR